MNDLWRHFPYYKQQDQMDCGPTCLRMLTKFYGKPYPIQELRNLCQISRSGVTLLDISEAAEKIGFRTLGVKLTLKQLSDVQLPCILHWNQYHFVVLYKIKNGKYYIADPAKGFICYSEEEFKESWFGNKELNDGISLILSPAPDFYRQREEPKEKLNWLSIFRYFYNYRQLFVQLFIGLGIGSFISLIAPILTQSIVDIGINGHNLQFIYIILIAQVMLFIGSTSVDFIQSWILLHVSTRINISILTDFLIKLLKLPLSFFEAKTTGDIMQRMNDQQKIESFLTSTTLNTIFSFFNLIIFTTVLAYYNFAVFLVSFCSTVLYTFWIINFLKRRRELNYRQFEIASKNQNAIIELVNGIVEIKLNNCEKQKRWGWEYLQANIFKFKVKSLALTQYQQAGSKFINQAKNIVITFITVRAVIYGEMTIGGMMAVQYIVGQVSNPIEQLLSFIQSYQDARISLERLNDVYQMEDEETMNDQYFNEFPINKGITIRNLTFRYPGNGNKPVLENINLHIPQGKITAIVGMSGSGKTTILKLLLRIFNPENGEIKIGDLRLDRISHQKWRSECGTVMQDGYIFADTILNNIAIGDENPDIVKVHKAIQTANLQGYIEDLRFGLNTQIGSGGSGLSAGQKQRLLIARAVYKNPQYLFFDEATNSLDANNEQIIMQNLQDFFIGRTVIIIAHRLSTVTNADNIIVLDKGKVIEQGAHRALIGSKGEYYTLVKNQLEGV